MGLNYISQNRTEKPAKELGMRCNCKSKTTACSELTEEEMQEICKYIWKLTWGEKRAFIQGLLEKCNPKRRYSKLRHHQRKLYLELPLEGVKEKCKSLQDHVSRHYRSDPTLCQISNG
ncbi:hypothetical protein PoB_002632900 [Plakobranchus ocellatus]|uniref:Uncharacterized protein n=1 Tax=Plakobranchus ocellatus TaxID=259542 RepID=A0AAV3ZWX3_9GAST|nr:hypothetical protein PoB_002632900 [Plakobranchus ocellatus]